jgi:U3 small nucleolar RNA-associated protein 7
MTKKEIREKLKEHLKSASENLTEIQMLDVLTPKPAELSSSELTHQHILKNINLYTKEKAFNLALENGPFLATYTSDGSNMLISSRQGYMAAYNTQDLNFSFEVNVAERINSIRWLHNQMYFAAAQKNTVFIYNSKGSELHCVRDLHMVRMMEFMPYHFLLACASETGNLKYLDTSIGSIVSTVSLNEKDPSSMSFNPSNGVVHIGSQTGQVALYAPSQKDYLMKVQCHKSYVTNIEIDRSGSNMITTGLDDKMSVFDIRNTFAPLKSIKTKAKVTAISQRNLIAVAYANKVVILKNFEEIYMKHQANGAVESLEFCNYEDILTIGHKNGIENIVVPGSGDPVYDSMEVTPFMNKKQRRELEVKRLLEKIPYDMIAQECILGNFTEKKKAVEKKPRYFEEEQERLEGALGKLYKNPK